MRAFGQRVIKENAGGGMGFLQLGVRMSLL